MPERSDKYEDLIQKLKKCIFFLIYIIIKNKKNYEES